MRLFSGWTFVSPAVKRQTIHKQMMMRRRKVKFSLLIFQWVMELFLQQNVSTPFISRSLLGQLPALSTLGKVANLCRWLVNWCRSLSQLSDVGWLCWLEWRSGRGSVAWWAWSRNITSSWCVTKPSARSRLTSSMHSCQWVQPLPCCLFSFGAVCPCIPVSEYSRRPVVSFILMLFVDLSLCVGVLLFVCFVLFAVLFLFVLHFSFRNDNFVLFW